MKPLVPAQDPSVETFLVAAGVGVGVGVALTEVAAAFTDETAPDPEQVPKADWQPAEQWSVVEPHQP